MNLRIGDFSEVHIEQIADWLASALGIAGRGLGGIKFSLPRGVTLCYAKHLSRAWLVASSVGEVLIDRVLSKFECVDTRGALVRDRAWQTADTGE